MPPASPLPAMLHEALQAGLCLAAKAVTTTTNSVHIKWREHSQPSLLGRQFQILLINGETSGVVVGRGCVETEHELASIRSFFLPSGRDFVAIVSPSSGPGVAVAFPFSTPPPPPVEGLPPQIYIGTSHFPLHPHQLVYAPSEYLWTDCWDAPFWRALFRVSLFCLPSDNRGCVLVPNPRMRFIVRLHPAGCDASTAPASSSTHLPPSPPTSTSPQPSEGLAARPYERGHPDDGITHPHGPMACRGPPGVASHSTSSNSHGDGHWFRSGKLRKHKRTFTLSVDRDFAGALVATARHHEEHKGSTWLTQECVAMLVRMHDDPVASGDVQWAVFELWDKVTGALAAVSIGFARGRAFHDVTACTFTRDHRSAGRVLLRVQGHLLERAGYTLWYLGFQVDYMAELCKHGGCQVGRQQFLQLWDDCQLPCGSCADAGGPHDYWANVLALVKNGAALVMPHQQAGGSQAASASNREGLVFA